MTPSTDLYRHDHMHKHCNLYQNHCDSPPSLTSSDTFVDDTDCGSPYTQENMTSAKREDVNDVLDDVIVKINRITDHLRTAGESEAANRLCRGMTTTFQELYNVIAMWDIEQCLMSLPSQSEISYKQPIAARYRNTWASVAATEPIADENGIIKFRPSDGVKQQVQEQVSVFPGHESKDRRVVWIGQWPASRPLRDISQEIQNLGAVYSIAYDPSESAVCIIFQHAYCAVEFMHKCAEYIGRNAISPFGKDHDVLPGNPYSMEDGLRAMEPPHNHRRRLTFARSQLFSNGVTEKRFRKDIEDIVGPSNIELVWLFNTGNATVVFSAVPLARLAREEFLKYGRTKGSPYAGVMVSYSHDPCERDMHLVSQIPGHQNYIGGGASGQNPPNRSHRSNTGESGLLCRRTSSASDTFWAGNKRCSPVSKPQLDDDGWQTVKKRR